VYGGKYSKRKEEIVYEVVSVYLISVQIEEKENTHETEYGSGCHTYYLFVEAGKVFCVVGSKGVQTENYHNRKERTYQNISGNEYIESKQNANIQKYSQFPE